MAKLGLQGKAIMPFLVSFGCTIGGAAGTRVIDNWGKRILTTRFGLGGSCARHLGPQSPMISACFSAYGLPL